MSTRYQTQTLARARRLHSDAVQTEDQAATYEDMAEALEAMPALPYQAETIAEEVRRLRRLAAELYETADEITATILTANIDRL